MYEPLKVETCKKCGKLIAEPRELIRIIKGKQDIGRKKRKPISVFNEFSTISIGLSEAIKAQVQILHNTLW